MCVCVCERERERERGLVAMNFLSICSSGKVFISASFVKDSFTRYSFLSWQMFFFEIAAPLFVPQGFCSVVLQSYVASLVVHLFPFLSVFFPFSLLLLGLTYAYRVYFDDVP